MVGKTAKERSIDKSRLKAIRAVRLYERGHSYEKIAELCNIPTGSVVKRIELGRRLLSLKGLRK